MCRVINIKSVRNKKYFFKKKTQGKTKKIFLKMKKRKKIW
jgi:hypothetical protein